jgi:hypothetical protein
LTTTAATIRIDGSGDAEIRAVDTLDAKLSGSGDVRYWGSPTITRSILGSGRIVKAGN